MTFSESYHDLILHIVPGPSHILCFVPVILLPIALLIPPSVLSHSQLCTLFLPIILASQTYYLLRIGPFDTLSGDVILRAFALLVAYDPRRTFKRVRYIDQKQGSTGKRKPKQSSADVSAQPVEQAYPAKLSARIPWVLTLLISLRFTRWKTGIRSHDEARHIHPVNRSQYAKYVGTALLRNLLILDAACFAAQSDPYFTTPIGIDSSFPSQSLSASTTPFPLRQIRTHLPPRLLRASIIAAQTYAAVTLMFLLPVLPALALNAFFPAIMPSDWSPHTWPVLWGPIVPSIGARGVRGLWGDWWHQLMRHLTITPARWLSAKLGLPRRSRRRFALLICSAFFFSGVLHAGIIPPEPPFSTRSANVLKLYMAAFFWVQPVAFAVEFSVSSLWGQRSLGRGAFLVKLLNFVWTGAWLCFTLPLLAIPIKELRYYDIYPLPISLFKGLHGEGWFPQST